MPVISVITINYNNAGGLQKTIDSVAFQTSKDFEFIVIDGDSTDNSSAIISKYSSIITYSVSEKDKGIYDAQNKGIAEAKGDFLIFMNSGDCFAENNTLSKITEFIQNNKAAKLVYGNTNLVAKNGSIELLCPPAVLDLEFFFTATLNHQSCIIHKSLFDSYGLFSTDYKICSDYDFLLKVFLKESNSFAYINAIICNYENYGTSANVKLFETVVAERKKIQQTLLSEQQLLAAKHHEIKLLGRKSKFFKLVPGIKSAASFYDKFYARWYQWRVK